MRDLRSLAIASLAVFACLAVGGCAAAASGPRAVTVSLVAPSQGATVGVRGIEVLGKVDPPTAIVFVDGRRARVVKGVFSRALRVRGKLRRIKVLASARGYIRTTVETTVFYSSAARPALASAAGSGGDSAQALSAAAAADVPVVSAPASPATSLGTPASFTNFMNGCTSSGRASAAGCKCLYTQVVAHPALIAELKALIENVVSTGALPVAAAMPADIRTAVLSCAAELG
jgi:hypothetical protein